MDGLGFSLFSIVWILTLMAMIIFRNKVIVFEWGNGLKIYIEDIDYEEDDDVEMQ